MGITDEDDDVSALQAVTRNLMESVASIEIEQWTLATPCSDWDLTALVDHVTGGNWFTVAILAGDRAEDAMRATMERFGGGSATSEAVIRSLENQVAAFLEPGALDRTWSHMAGSLVGRQILRLRLHDLIVHSWDIEVTLRPGAALSDGLVRWGLDELAHDESLTAGHFEVVHRPGLRSAEDKASGYREVFGR